MDKEDKRGIFFGIIGVLTLVVAIIGASLAYFSINAQSADNAVQVQAATVQIDYEDGQLLTLKELIPANKDVALETLRRGLKEEMNGEAPYQVCVDDNGYNVCGVYEFTIRNSSTKSITANANIIPNNPEIQPEELEKYKFFQNLKYQLYDITDVSTDLPSAQDTALVGKVINEGKMTYELETKKYTDVKMGENVIQVPAATTSEANEIVPATKKYRLFIWLDNLQDSPQDYEQGASYNAKITVDVAGAGNGQISGNADKAKTQ